MHDVFTLVDLANDGQQRMLGHWLEVARADPTVPLAAIDLSMLHRVLAEKFVLFDLAAGAIRDGRILNAGAAIRGQLGFDPIGLTLADALPPSYLADMIPAYALSAGLFLPAATQDELHFTDGGTALIQRLVLPLDRRASGAAHAARHMLLTFDTTTGGGAGHVGRLEDIVRVTSRGLWLYRDPPGVSRTAP